MTVIWAMPVLTDRTMGWDTLENSYLFGGMGLVGIVAAVVVSCCSHKVQDRHLILWNQIIAGCGFLPLAFLGGCQAGNSSASHAAVVVAGALVWTVGFQGQVPGNVSLYSKMVGAEDAGLYQALFQMVMTCARIACSALIGGATDLCTVFTTAAVLWVLQWVVLLLMWRRLHPTVYEAYHEASLAAPDMNISLRQVES
ncbi:unnamed protein product [Polarella glacialis]|uniref:Uncharacterized protein n=1 Tax=Polarella glacialis TaxID=89957 RepID=A0A813F1W8_POLGL|nr:unnamed protein product [Polarella glacialis]